MIIIFFSTAKKGPAERMLGDIQTKIQGHRIEVDRTVEALCDRFHYPIIDRAIMILVPENREQLEQLISIGNLINDRPILLVLPDREPATISSGHRLYPRFVTYLDTDFSDLVAVLSKLIHHVSKKRHPVTMTSYNSQEIELEVRRHGILYDRIKPLKMDVRKEILDHLSNRKKEGGEKKWRN